MSAPVSRVYILCFVRPYWHARHYIVFVADGDTPRRVRQHLAGQGSPLGRRGGGGRHRRRAHARRPR